MSFARKFGDEYGRKLMDTATKAGIDVAKTASKRVVQLKIVLTPYKNGIPKNYKFARYNI